MRFLLSTMLLLFTYSASGQQYRYSNPIFNELIIHRNIVYTNAPKLVGFLNDESNTIDTDYLMDIYLPDGDDLSQRPAIIFVHGGAFVSGNRNHDDMVSFCDSLAKRGYVTATIDYRLGMYAMSSQSAQRAVYRGLQDGRSAVRFLRAEAATYGIDPNRIFMGGSSAGAFICLQTAFMNDPDEKPAVASSYTYTNPIIPFNQITAPDLGSYDSGQNLDQDGSVAAIYCLWGALQHTNLIKTKELLPICLIHGTNDQVVPFDVGSPFNSPSLPETYGSNAINNKLIELNYQEVDTWFVEGAGHEFYGVSNGNWAPVPNQYWAEAVEKASDFFYRQTKPTANFIHADDGLSVSFFDQSLGATTWLWDFGDGSTSTEQNPTHQYISSGTYTVNLHIENEIRSWDEAESVFTIDNTSIYQQALQTILVYPNPVKNELFINHLPDGSLLNLYAIEGKKVTHIKPIQSYLRIDMADYPDGLYLLVIEHGDMKLQRRIIKTTD